jgi:hypothetical protein
MYKPGSYDESRFSSVFGLKPVSEENAYSKGSTTGTKQVAGLGTYLTEDDYNRLRNSDKVKDAYAEVYGQSAADKKFEGNPDGLSINALDALFDKLAQVDEQTSETLKTPDTDPVKEKAAEGLLKTVDRVNAFKADMEGTGENNLSDFLFVPRRDRATTTSFDDSFDSSKPSDSAVDVIASSSMPTFMQERALGKVSPQNFLDDAKNKILRLG